MRDGTTGNPTRNILSNHPPDYLMNGRLFSRLSRRNQARLLFGWQSLRRSLDPTIPVDLELADAIDTEFDRLHGLMAGATR